MTAAADAGVQGGKRWVERGLLLAAWLAVAWFHVWTVRLTDEPLWPEGEQRDYFNLLIDGWLDGQLHMKVEVPEELRRLPDPYDPAQRRPGLGLHDASFYRGKYYVYFGVAPAVSTRLRASLPLPQAASKHTPKARAQFLKFSITVVLLFGWTCISAMSGAAVPTASRLHDPELNRAVCK